MLCLKATATQIVQTMQTAVNPDQTAELDRAGGLIVNNRQGYEAPTSAKPARKVTISQTISDGAFSPMKSGMNIEGMNTVTYNTQYANWEGRLIESGIQALGST